MRNGNNYSSMPKTGGGCAPKGIHYVAPNYREIFADAEKKRTQWEIEHLAWLASPEGLAWQAAQEVIRQQELAEQKKKDEEQQRRNEWLAKSSEIFKTKPAVGSIVKAAVGSQVLIYLKRDGNRYSAWALLRCPDIEYPKLPEWQLASGGRFGLKIFLDWKSTRALMDLDLDSVSQIDRAWEREQAYKNAPKPSPGDLDYVYFDSYNSSRYYQSASNFDPCETTMAYLISELRIIGYSTSGKSGTGQLV